MVGTTHDPGPGRAAARQGGFAYLVVLLFVALFGAISASVVTAGSAMARRDAEQELLFVGAQFRDAIRRYHDAGVGGGRYPTTLEALLRDPRIPGTHRHLRRIYVDPLTGDTDWGLALAPEGVGIVGVYSKAAGTPLKVDGFAPEFQAFKGATSYSQWVFSYVPQAAAQGGTRPPPRAGTGTAPGVGAESSPPPR